MTIREGNARVAGVFSPVPPVGHSIPPADNSVVTNYHKRIVYPPVAYAGYPLPQSPSPEAGGHSARHFSSFGEWYQQQEEAREAQAARAQVPDPWAPLEGLTGLVDEHPIIQASLRITAC